jgi:NADH dehydrogenase FAD-containing subunit
LTERGSSCTIVMLEPVVLSRGFGEQAGRFFQGRLEEHGITVVGEDSLARFEGSGGRVTTVVTQSGRELEADAVVIGAGVHPEVTLARGAGLALGERGGVLASSLLETEAPGVFVAGDIAEYESVIHDGSQVRIEHWDVAFNQGKTAALNMLGRAQDHDVVPYFFSDLSDWASLEYVGPALRWDEEVVRGSIDEGEFSVWYLEGGTVAAALSVGRSDDLEHARRLIASSAGVPAEAIGDPHTDLASLHPPS